MNGSNQKKPRNITRSHVVLVVLLLILGAVMLRRLDFPAYSEEAVRHELSEYERQAVTFRSGLTTGRGAMRGVGARGGNRSTGEWFSDATGMVVGSGTLIATVV